MYRIKIRDTFNAMCSNSFCWGVLLNIFIKKEIFHEILFGVAVVVFLLLVFVCKFARHMFCRSVSISNSCCSVWYGFNNTVAFKSGNFLKAMHLSYCFFAFLFVVDTVTQISCGHLPVQIHLGWNRACFLSAAIDLW